MTILRTVLAAVALLAMSAACADGSHPRLLLSANDIEANADTWRSSALFSASVTAVQADLAGLMDGEPVVPVPVDAGGGYTHETHKRNGIAIQAAGFLYQWTGEARYAEFAAEMLSRYADMYPGLPNHPQKKEQSPGRLFWQSLNEAVWLVYAIQGYDAVVDTLSEQHRAHIENNLLRPMADFLSVESPQTYDRIHNHGTWAVAAVGMTGYVIDDEDYVLTALYGLKKDGSAGFLKQLDELFSPDGYYAEGPYYQRYALMPFVVFAGAIQQNEPERRIFEQRDNILQKAIKVTAQLSYAGKFFPLNDAIKDKGLDTVELAYGAVIAFGLTSDDSLLSLIDPGAPLILTGDGLKVARAIESGEVEAFDFRTMLLRDGAGGDRGALSILRAGDSTDGSAVVFKATSQGMGHGHFDRLNWLYFDNGHEVISDYGAARFLNVVQKNGGHYLPENNAWAKQSIAHNTLVVDQASQFGGDWKQGEKSAPQQLLFESSAELSISSALETNAYSNVDLRRTIAMVSGPEFERPLVINVLNALGSGAKQLDLPMYFAGHVISTSKEVVVQTDSRKPFGADNGYQYLWRIGDTSVGAGEPFALTWILGNRFYTWTAVSQAASEFVFVELGANDPNFNLRREQGIVQRVVGTSSNTFAGVLEAHGEYNGAREYTVRSTSQVSKLESFESGGKNVVRITTSSGAILMLALSFDPDPDKAHAVDTPHGRVAWTGFYDLISSGGET